MDTQITKLVERIEKLEKAVFGGGGTQRSRTPTAEEQSSGPTGGVKLLISKGFFAKQRTAADVATELKRMGYIGYQRQVIQNSLNRLSAKKGILIASLETGTRMYAKRK